MRVKGGFWGGACSEGGCEDFDVPDPDVVG